MPRHKTKTLESPRSTTEIYRELMQAEEQEDEGTTRYRGMTYEQGVGAVIRWILGSSDDYPMTEK